MNEKQTDKWPAAQKMASRLTDQLVAALLESGASRDRIKYELALLEQVLERDRSRLMAAMRRASIKVVERR